MPDKTKTIADLIRDEAEHVEQAEKDTQDETRIPDNVKVTRGNPRSKVLQVRLTAEEYEAIERIAARRDLPVSTIAREQLLKIVDDDPVATAYGIVNVIHAATQLNELALSLRNQIAHTPMETQKGAAAAARIINESVEQFAGLATIPVMTKAKYDLAFPTVLETHEVHSVVENHQFYSNVGVVMAAKNIKVDLNKKAIRNEIERLVKEKYEITITIPDGLTEDQAVAYYIDEYRKKTGVDLPEENVRAGVREEMQGRELT